jgi:uncharacterized cupin superfamily protein
MTFVARIDTAPIAPLTDAVAPEKVASGAPITGVRTALERPEKGLYTGVWASSVGSWRVSYDEDELCVLLEGRIRLVGDDGVRSEFVAGDAFTIARGFRGIWETIEPARKIYAIVT